MRISAPMPDAEQAEKAELRRACLALRRRTPADEKRRADASIVRQIAALPAFCRASAVFLYAPLWDEPDLLALCAATAGSRFRSARPADSWFSGLPPRATCNRVPTGFLSQAGTVRLPRRTRIRSAWCPVLRLPRTERASGAGAGTMTGSLPDSPVRPSESVMQIFVFPHCRMFRTTDGSI